MAAFYLHLQNEIFLESFFFSYPTNCVRSGNLNPWKLKVDAGLERGTLAGGGRRSAVSLEVELCKMRPH